MDQQFCLNKLSEIHERLKYSKKKKKKENDANFITQKFWQHHK